MDSKHELKELTPRCRVCGIEPEDINIFCLTAQEHNEDPMNSMHISPKTVCYSGHYYNPSTNSFICPDCEKTMRDEGKEDMYATNTNN